MSEVNYFKATEIAKRSWMIEYAFTDREHVYCYLVEGRDYALLIDTMYGYGSLKAFCETLSDKPVKLVLTHFHLDHMAGNAEFGSCYMHHLDIANYLDSQLPPQEAMLAHAKEEAFPEIAGKMELSDMVPFAPVLTYPLYDGDLLDLGDRTIEVVWVGGHSAGSVAFIDKERRIAYTGDCCNGNTLLGFGNSLPVETYMKNLLHFKHYQKDFDMMYGGHQVLPPTVIDEGIELCARVIAGTDDKEEVQGLHGRTAIYAAKHGNSPIERADGKLFNMCYKPERILAEEKKARVIDFKPVPMF